MPVSTPGNTSEQPRYANLAELRDAYARGDLTEPLMLDNDQATVYHDAGGDYEKVWDSHPEQMLKDALDLLGIPHEQA
jgi:hypothetical protein